MKNLKLGFLALGLIYMPSVVQGGVFGPSDFDECVMDSANNAKTALATAHVRDVCSRKYPKTVPPSEVDLTANLIKSGVLLTPAQYRFVYEAYYKNMTYEDFLRTLYERNVRPYHPNMTLQEFRRKALP